MASVRRLGFFWVRVWTTDQHLVIFGAVQNLVRIHAAVSVICRFQYFMCWAGKANSRPKIGALGEI